MVVGVGVWTDGHDEANGRFTRDQKIAVGNQPAPPANGSPLPQYVHFLILCGVIRLKNTQWALFVGSGVRDV